NDEDSEVTAALLFAHPDSLGSVRLLTGTKGEVRERTDWGAWGERLIGGKLSRIGYTGHQLERASGFHYSVHRYLDSRIGRWTQRDPIGFKGGRNQYAYVFNNATTLTDPLGLVTPICVALL